MVADWMAVFAASDDGNGTGSTDNKIHFDAFAVKIRPKIFQ